jgi:hypothetical protein
MAHQNERSFLPQASSDTVPRFGMFEKGFTHAGAYENPYKDVTASATLVRPDGREWRIPLFWDGGASWVLRVSPDVEGGWSWSVSSPDKGLDGRRGTFRCVKSDLRGGIQPMEGHPHHFQYQDGSPFFFFGDKAWRVLQTDRAKRLDHDSAMHHVDVRAEQGFTYMHTELAGTGGLHSTGNEGGAMLPDPGGEVINPAFFQEADRRIRHINEKGIILGFVLLYALGTPSWRTVKDPEARLRFSHYVVARYAAYHVVFIVTGEWQYMLLSFEAFRGIGREIRTADPHGRMIGIHAGPGPYFSSQDFGGDDWNSFGDYAQAYFAPEREEAADWCRHDLREFIIFGRRHGKPVVDCEYAYYLRDQDFDGIVDKPNSHTRDSFRRASWMMPMGGGYFVTGFGTTYFGGWREVGPFLVDNPRHADAVADLKRLKAFFTALPWWLMEPHDELLTRSGSAGYAYCLAEPGSTYAVYTVGCGGARLTLAGGAFTAARLDPRTGETTPLPGPADSSVELPAPDAQDWVFLVRRKAGGA